ncbi:MAG: nuclear transport factor 2 family protein [Phycicoccus sp.]|nr:nuclear transport factor 2 family protein [Phycicoccus sp.]
MEAVRRAYAALEAGDMYELEKCFARDAVWHEPGSNIPPTHLRVRSARENAPGDALGGNIYSGNLVGWPEIRDEFLLLLGPLSRGTLRAELVDIAVGEKYVVAVHRATGQHNGVTLRRWTRPAAR